MWAKTSFLSTSARKSDGERFIEFMSSYHFMSFIFKVGSSQIRHGNVHILYRFWPLRMQWREAQKAKMSSD